MLNAACYAHCVCAVNFLMSEVILYICIYSPDNVPEPRKSNYKVVLYSNEVNTDKERGPFKVIRIQGTYTR